MTMLISILISVSSATQVPRPCIYSYFYDSGVKDTYCVLIKETDTYLNHGDFVDDRFAILDCSAGIINRRESITKTQPALIETISSKCFEPQDWEKRIIEKLYKKAKVNK